MEASDIRATLSIVKNAQERTERMNCESATEGKPISTTQALLAASWSLRSAAFALQLAIGLVESTTQQDTNTNTNPSRVRK
jgi:hypothetical protein